MPSAIEPSYRRSQGLVDLLDRVLDKGLVIAGDIRVSLAEVELLTIRVRLLVCSIDKAEQIGLDWWRHDPHLTIARQQLAEENEQLRGEVRRLERRLSALEAGRAATGQAARAPEKARPRRGTKDAR
jgi:hypothetical protein